MASRKRTAGHRAALAENERLQRELDEQRRANRILLDAEIDRQCREHCEEFDRQRRELHERYWNGTGEFAPAHNARGW
jgi:hypothetical protein